MLSACSVFATLSVEAQTPRENAADPEPSSVQPETSLPVEDTAGLPADAAQQLSDSLHERIAELNQRLAQEPDSLELTSARGDVLFFDGQFTAAVGDYNRMLELEPQLKNSHWRRGIALFYAGKYRQAARQFEDYHSFDNVDRENGIWRYLCQVRAYGERRARQDLLKYEKDDREPFPDVYRLFAGELTPEKIRERIAAAQVSATEREKREFYAELYIGLWESVHDRPAAARAALHRAVRNTWGPTAGFGPSYMWHVGRVHLNVLNSQAERSTGSDQPEVKVQP